MNDGAPRYNCSLVGYGVQRVWRLSGQTSRKGGFLIRRRFCRKAIWSALHVRADSCGLDPFAFNAFSFYSFAQTMEEIYGARSLLMIYGSSILGGSLLSLAIHRNHDYRSLGAVWWRLRCHICFDFSPAWKFNYHVSASDRYPGIVRRRSFSCRFFCCTPQRSDNSVTTRIWAVAIIGLLVATALYPGLIFAALDVCRRNWCCR